MLDSWNEGIFSTIKSRLQSSAMKLVHAERNGEAFDSQLVIGVRESYGKESVIFKCTNLKIVSVNDKYIITTLRQQIGQWVNLVSHLVCLSDCIIISMSGIRDQGD